MIFYDKPLRIAYAKTKSHATLRKEDPDFVPPNSVHAQENALVAKRQHDDDATDGERQPKREKAEGDNNDDGVEMEIDEDDDS